MLSELNFKNFNPKSNSLDESLYIYLKPHCIYCKKREEKKRVIGIFFEKV